MNKMIKMATIVACAVAMLGIAGCGNSGTSSMSPSAEYATLIREYNTLFVNQHCKGMSADEKKVQIEKENTSSMAEFNKKTPEQQKKEIDDLRETLKMMRTMK